MCWVKKECGNWATWVEDGREKEPGQDDWKWKWTYFIDMARKRVVSCRMARKLSCSTFKKAQMELWIRCLLARRVCYSSLV